MLERRQSMRVSVRLLGRYALAQGATPSVAGEVLGTVDEGEVHNLSSGGLLLSTSRPLPLGANLQVEIETSSESSPLRIWGRVIWVSDDNSGIEIVDVLPDVRARIDELIEQSLRDASRGRSE